MKLRNSIVILLMIALCSCITVSNEADSQIETIRSGMIVYAQTDGCNRLEVFNGEMSLGSVTQILTLKQKYNFLIIEWR